MKFSLLILFFPIILFAQSSSQKLESYLNEQVRINNFSGTILVTRNDTVLLKKAYGFADPSRKVINNTDTKFQIASITKEFTAACILQLEEQGKLSVNDKLSKYFTGFPSGDSITIHMLLCHISGIKNNWPAKMYYSFIKYENQKAINYIKKQKLLFTPGTSAAYSPLGYFLLSRIIEKASGQSYEDYLADHIFKPLSMNNSGCFVKEIKIDNKAKPAKTKRYGFDLSKRENFKFISGGGMIYSTLDDLYKWDRSYYSNTILSEVSKKKKFTPYKGYFGYGESIDTFQTHYRIRHEGVGDGYTSCLYHYVKDNVCITMLCNGGTNTFAMPEALSAIVFNKPYELPYHHKKAKIDPALLNNYVGKYCKDLRSKRYSEVTRKKNKLFLDGVEMKPESTTKFFLEDGSDRQIEFILDNNGKVIQTWFYRGGVKTERIKIN